MNRLTGTISSIERSGSIILADVDAAGQQFSVLMISAQEVPLWLHMGSPIGLIFKETEVSLGKNIAGTTSMLNRLSCVVERVRRGDILTVVEMTCAGQTITSAITTRSAEMLQIAPRDHVTAFINANEITLSDRRG
jgi:molybdate transport system regulatory protein